jgi:hypothetical protein
MQLILSADHPSLCYLQESATQHLEAGSSQAVRAPWELQGTQDNSSLKPFFSFFFFLMVLIHTCKAGTLVLKPHLHPPLL